MKKIKSISTRILVVLNNYLVTFCRLLSNIKSVCVQFNQKKIFLIIGMVLVMLLPGQQALALSSQSLLFEQHFESLDEIQQAAGTCVIGGLACTPSVLVPGDTGNSIQFNKTNFPVVQFEVANPADPLTNHIDPLKGTIEFNYVPLGTPDGDWESSTPTSKVFFHLHDSALTISMNQTLKIGTYYNPVKNTHYLFFRYDGTSGCSIEDPLPVGVPNCFRETSTHSAEPGVIMQWQPETAHKIIATWDFTVPKPFLALFVDGNFAGFTPQDAVKGLDGFLPSAFYVGSLNGSSPAQGRIDNLTIYGDVLIDPTDPVAGYVDLTRNDGVWQPHETIYDSNDAPTPLNLGGQPFVIYPSHDFEAIYEGSVPANANDPAEIVVHIAKNQHHTAFFNIYSGDQDLGIVTASISDLTNGTATLDQQTKIKIRTVKNWWQASKNVVKELIPAYTPELLVYDDTSILKCTGALPKPCSGASFPSDPPREFTTTEVKANTSRQFAVTLDVADTMVAGTYVGNITVSTVTLGQRILPLKVIVHDFVLPEIDKTVALYNHSQFDTTTENYVTPAIYLWQLRNMVDHGVNGVTYYGESPLYPQVASPIGLKKFATYMSAATVSATQEKVSWLNDANLTPYFYGVDEPDLIRSNGRNTIPEHLAKSKIIHEAGGKVVVAINKEWGDVLNDSTLFPYQDELGKTYTYVEARLDLPNLNIGVAKTKSYLDSLLSKEGVKPLHPELYYWQMDREDPRINRYYAGYHLWLTDLAGVFPYVYQKVVNDTFNDFDQASGNERDLNLVYPSLEGGIDTIQWEAFRTGLDDYRLLQHWKTLHDQIDVSNPGIAQARQAALDSLLEKYRAADAYKAVAIRSYADDRDILISEIDDMNKYLNAPDSDYDGLNDEVDSAPTDLFMPNGEGVNLSHRAAFNDPQSSETQFVDSESLHILAWSDKLLVMPVKTATWELVSGATILDAGTLSPADVLTGQAKSFSASAALTGLAGIVTLNLYIKDGGRGKAAKDFAYSTNLTISGGVINIPPEVTITQPTDGSNIASGQQINFVAMALDTEDLDISSNISWKTTDEIIIGNGAMVATTLLDGVHTVMATVIDSGGASNVDSITITVGPIVIDPITLSVTTDRKKAVLNWSGASGGFVDVYLDEEQPLPVENTGSYSDSLNKNAIGTHFYQVCETDSQTRCSDTVSVTF